MIPIGADFEEGDLIALRDVQAHSFQDLIDFFTEHDSSVFGWAHNMV
jgi:hypothetical protein